MKRMLFIAHRLPYPPNKGDKIRAFHLLKYLSKHYEIDLITFVDTKEDLIYKDKLLTYCSDMKIFKLNKYIALIKALFFLLLGKSLSVGYYASSKIKTMLAYKLNTKNYDVLFAYSSQTAQYLINYTQYNRVMDFVDVDSQKWFQYSEEKKFPLNLIYKLEANQLSKFEKMIGKEFRASIFSTNNELNLFKRIGGDGKLFVINNGVDFQYFRPIKKEKEEAIIFVGAMDYFPNIDGVNWFVKDILPNILKKIPQLKFYIVGSNPTKEILNLKNDNVIVTGFVDDVRPYLAKAKLAVIPLRIARGIQNKILEAMSMEVPVVMHNDLAKTLDGIDRDVLFTYKNNKEFCDQIILNLNRNDQLSENGKKLRLNVITKYSWKENVNKLVSLIQSSEQ